MLHVARRRVHNPWKGGGRASRLNDAASAELSLVTEAGVDCPTRQQQTTSSCFRCVRYRVPQLSTLLLPEAQWPCSLGMRSHSDRPTPGRSVGSCKGRATAVVPRAQGGEQQLSHALCKGSFSALCWCGWVGKRSLSPGGQSLGRTSQSENDV